MSTKSARLSASCRVSLPGRRERSDQKTPRAREELVASSRGDGGGDHVLGVEIVSGVAELGNRVIAHNRLSDSCSILRAEGHQLFAQTSQRPPSERPHAPFERCFGCLTALRGVLWPVLAGLRARLTSPGTVAAARRLSHHILTR